MKKTRGFTLIELVAIIVVLALIALITIPIITDIIDKARKNSFKDSAYGILKSAEIKKVSWDMFDIKKRNLIFTYEDGIEKSNIINMKLDYNGKAPKEGILVIKDSGNIAFMLHNGKWCAEKSYTEYEVSITDKTEDECLNQISIPKIELLGDNPLYVEINTEFFDPSAIITNNTEDEPMELTSVIKLNNSIVPKIDVTKLNEYKIIYTTNYGGNDINATRTVVVRDTIKPIITIPENITLKVDELADFNPREGVSVTDNSLEEIEFIITGNLSTVPGEYTLTYIAKDSSGNESQVTRIVTVVDVLAPLITILGDNPININVGDTYIDAGATASDDVDGDITSKIVVTGTVNPSVLGTHIITYTVEDNAGNITTSSRVVNVIDNILPTIAFGTNGNTAYAQSRSTIVTVSDANSGVNASSLKYQWTTSTTLPTEASFTTTFTNGESITSTAGLTGSYYLWILAKDNAGNTLITSTNVFNLDNIKPTITMNGTTPVNITVGGTYTDAGATASDTLSGVGGVTATGTVNTGIAGTYTITYTVSDAAGNAATPVTRTVNVNSFSQYSYRTSSSYQSCDTCYDTCSSPASVTYSCSSGWSLSGSTCYRTVTNYHCFDPIWENLQYSCSLGSYNSSTGCCDYYDTTTESTSASSSYSCSLGYLSGSTCYYSCNPYSCNCSTITNWSSWSSWSTTPATPSSSRQVQRRECLNTSCTSYNGPYDL